MITDVAKLEVSTYDSPVHPLDTRLEGLSPRELCTPLADSYASLNSITTPPDSHDILGHKTGWRKWTSPALSLDDLLSNVSLSPRMDKDGRIERTEAQKMEESDGVDFVSPLFLWVSPTENKVTAKRKEQAQKPKNAADSLFPPPVTKAKSALRRRMSGAVGAEVHRNRVREAEDACMWLRSAGFPQYVQKFEAGEFPLNLAKLKVEKDHSFLDPPAIDALIKRLNVLNRCADILDRITSKEDESDDDDNDVNRALSEQWTYSSSNKWSRATSNNFDATPTIVDSSLDEDVMVSELSTSPTQQHGRLVKTFTFNIDGNGSRDVRKAGTNASYPSFVIEEESNLEEENLECLGSFATGMLSAFDVKLKMLDNMSRSLPNVFAASNEFSRLGRSPNLSINSDLSEEYILDLPTTNGSWDSTESSPHQDLSHSPSLSPSLSSRIRKQNTLECFESSCLETASDNQRPPSAQSVKSKWHSFQRQSSFRHAFKPLRILIPIEELSAGQINVLRKLSLVKLTALIELYKGKANLSRILRSRKHKSLSIKNKAIFGVPLITNVALYGRAIHPIISNAMDYLLSNGMGTVGIFRRTAAKAKVETLKKLIEESSETLDFKDCNHFEIADIIKLYFRLLPEPLLTDKLSEVLIVIFERVPEEVRLQTLQSVMLLLPDENREALQCLLHFLYKVSTFSSVHQMDVQNLSLCLAPTLFSLHHSSRTSSLSRKGSLRRTHAISINASLSPNKELDEHILSSRCMAELIHQYSKLFHVAADTMQLCKFTHLELGDPIPYQDLGGGGVQQYLDDCMATMIKEQRRRHRGWVQCDSIRDVELAYNKIDDGIPLRLWRGVVEVPATPTAVLHRLWEERLLWDGNVVKGRQISEVDPHTEVFQYVTPSLKPLSDRDHCVLRSWQSDGCGGYVLLSTSVSDPNATLMGGIRCTELAVRYLVEPAHNHSTQLTIFCRVDMRGRSPEYYNYGYGKYLASSIRNIRDSFKRTLEMDYIETPV